MIVGIFLYYIWILLCALLFHIVLRCTYEDKSYTKRVQYPIWLYATAVVVSLVPGVNIIGFIALCLYIADRLSCGFYFKHFLLKKI